MPPSLCAGGTAYTTTSSGYSTISGGTGQQSVSAVTPPGFAQVWRGMGGRLGGGRQQVAPASAFACHAALTTQAHAACCCCPLGE